MLVSPITNYHVLVFAEIISSFEIYVYFHYNTNILLGLTIVVNSARSPKCAST
jgi:hypothetical protein